MPENPRRPRLDILYGPITDEEQAAAAKTLYSGLTNEQKLIANSRLAELLKGAEDRRPLGDVPDRQKDRRKEMEQSGQSRGNNAPIGFPGSLTNYSRMVSLREAHR
jgi:hypothetical protein